jgi:hypothetical protein
MIPGVVTRTVIATIPSGGTVESGQAHRCSGDFTFQIPDGTFVLQYGVFGGDAATVTFSIYQDVGSGQPDQLITTGMTNGSYSSVWTYPLDANFYVGDPAQNPSGGSFTVQLFAVSLVV